MPWRRFLAMGAALLSITACQRTASPDLRTGTRAREEQVQFLAEEFVHTTLALSPATATGQGYHSHHGVELDEQLDDLSPANLARARKFYQLTLKQAADLSSQEPGAEKSLGVTSEMRADLDVIRLACESNLLELDKIQSYRHNPTQYVELIGNAVYSPLVLDYAPERKRLGQITARIEKIPAFLETAKQNLADAPELWNQVAQSEDEGNIALIDQTIRAKIPADLKARYDAAATRALQALKSFDTWLKTDLAKRKSDWRLGPERYAEKFKLTLATGDTPAEALADAEPKLGSIREDMRKGAGALYPKFFPGKTAPADLNTAVAQVLDKIAGEHATPAEYFADAKRDLAEAATFVKDHQLLTLPDASNLQVIPTPEFMRGIYGVGGFSPAPVLEPKLGAFYWITPFTPDMTAARVESKLREYNRYGLKILTVHEAMPGHYVQFEYADRLQPAWRRQLRAIFSNGPYVEGWAVYATELMIDAGYPEPSPEMRLTFEKQMLRVVSNTILDVKLQTMGMTDQAALDLMINDTFQEKEEAEKKLQRAKLSSCQLPTYFVGWRGWDRLRDKYRNEQGANFKVAEFNERGLREGGVPFPELSTLLVSGK